MKKTSVILLSLILSLNLVRAAHHETSFSSLTFDLGCVVSDVDAAVEFYTEAVGFKVAGSFSVDGEYADEVGLTNGSSLNVTVLTLGDGEGATKLKLMSTGNSAPVANQHINTSLGFSYITIFVKSMDDALARLEKAGVKTVAKSPLALPGNLDPSMALTIIRDPDGNLVELVGPKPTK